MFARIVSGALLLGTIVIPAKAENMNADQARKFVAGKLFAFNCFDGTKGLGKIFDDGSVQGNVQFGGTGSMRSARLPSNTLQVRGQQICASIKGLPFEPCFNLDKSSEVSFRGSVSGLGFAYCDFRKQGNGRVYLARSLTRSRPTQSADASRPPATRTEPALELRRSTSQ